MAGEPIRITLLGDVSDLARSMARASSEVNGLGNNLTHALQGASDEADRLGDEVQHGVDGAGDSLSGFGKKFAGLAAAAGVAVGAALAVGLHEAMDREAGNAKLAAQLGADPAQAKTLGQAAGKVYSAGYGESVADANEALKSLWQQGLVPAGATSAEMAKISKSAMDVASVLGEEVGPTANAVGTMMKNGLAKNADEAMDILVAGTQRGANKAEDLLDTFNEYSVQFKKVGLDGKTAMGLIQQGLQGGARDADTVADAIKEFSIRAIDGSATTIDGFKSIGLNADDMQRKIAAGGPTAEKALGLTLDKLRAIKDPAERSAAAVNLFGTKAEDMGDALYSLNVDTAVSALGKVDGAADTAGKTMHDTAANKISVFTRSLETFAVDVIGGKVLPMVESFVGKLKTLASWIEQNKTPILTVAGVITAVMLPALIQWGVQSVTSAALAVGAWISSATTATGSALTQVAASWSVVGGWLKAGAQALLSGAIIVGQWVAGAASAILNAAIMVAQWVLMGTQAMLQAARMAAAWLLAMGPIPLIIAAIVGLALIIWQNWDSIKQWTGEAFDWVWDKIKAVFNWLKDLFLNFTGPGLIIKHWDTIKNATANAFNVVKEKAKAGLDAVVGFFQSLPGRILGIVGSIGNAAASVGRTIIDKLGQGLSALAGFGKSIGDAVARGLKTAINSLIDLLNWAIPDRIGIGPIGVDLPHNPIPKIRAMGGPASGLTRVGERGPEWLNLPKGSSVVPNHAGPSGGGVVVNVQTNADPYAIGRSVAWALRTT
ncbi:phage tail tape measure protein [Streptomyces sp. NPDC058092]|uniref:phage tail tape measure protein n=1 Tax=Streptomyces sp. NPDC058092 TaxID=3346336 RepID=UPI0036E7E9F8